MNSFKIGDAKNIDLILQWLSLNQTLFLKNKVLSDRLLLKSRNQIITEELKPNRLKTEHAKKCFVIYFNLLLRAVINVG